MGIFDILFSKTYSAVLHISSANGFHLRPAARFVAKAKKFQAEMEAENRGKSVNAKQLNALLSLNLEPGDHFELTCRGKDAQEACDTLTEYFTSLMQDDREIELLSKTEEEYEAPAISGEIIAGGIAMAPVWQYRETETEVEAKVSFEEAVSESMKALEILHETHRFQQQGEVYLAQKELLDSLQAEATSLEGLEEAVLRVEKALSGGKLEAKVDDYYDILHRVKSYLGYQTTVAYPKEPFILIADELRPSQIETLRQYPVAGVILRHTTLASHAAILLRAASIPSLIIENDSLPESNEALLDAGSGLFIPTPTTQDRAKAEHKQTRHILAKQDAFEKRFEPARTKDNKPIQVFANVTDTLSAKQAKEEGAEGIGLLRTEFLFKKERPSFKSQVETYTQIFTLFDEITVRTLDVGGDKALPYVQFPHETNPFLGIRGIRLLQTHPDMIEEQIHAIFKAANGKAIKLMFPMISSVEEFNHAKAFSKEVARKFQCDIDNISFGIMVEVPSVLFAMEAFNTVVDFYSIGSNDLNQYLFAIERTHPSLSLPSRSKVLFDAIETIVTKADKPVSICGELAGDPEAIPILIEMGIETLSVSPSAIAQTKERIRNV